MLDLHTLTTYVAVILRLFVIPGPAVLLTLGCAASGGVRIGVVTGLGIAVGDLIHAASATLGLSALLTASALAFQIVKYVGVAYLVYLGLRALLETPGPLEVTRATRAEAGPAFRQAMLAEVLNPKTALFFLAFLPQFVQPERGSVAGQLAALGVIFAVLGAVYTTLVALGVRLAFEDR